MICRHGGTLTHWFTSERKDWEIKWCERCGALRKYNISKKVFEWINPQWLQQEINKKKKSKKKVK